MEHLRRSGAKNPERSAEKLVDQEFETFEDLLNFSSSRLYDMLMKECSLKAKSADLVVEYCALFGPAAAASNEEEEEDGDAEVSSVASSQDSSIASTAWSKLLRREVAEAAAMVGYAPPDTKAEGAAAVVEVKRAGGQPPLLRQITGRSHVSTFELKEKLEEAEIKKALAEAIADTMREKKNVAESAKEVSEFAAVCADDVAKAESAVARAMAALESLNGKLIGELWGMNTPPAGVGEVFACTACIIAGIMPSIEHKNNKVQDMSWPGVKKQCLSNVAVYMDSLLHVKTVIDDMQFPAVNAAEAKKIIATDGYDPEVIKTENRTAAVLCSFTIYIIEYYDIMLSMDPKRKALAEANATLDAANTKLASMEALVADLNAKLATLTVELNVADAEEAGSIDVANVSIDGRPDVHGSSNDDHEEAVLAANRIAKEEVRRQQSQAQRTLQPTSTRSEGHSRGHYGINDEDHPDIQLAKLCVAELSGCGWADVDPSKVEVEDCSGQGGSQTFRVSAPEGTTPRTVALHSRTEMVTTDSLGEAITEAAALLFSSRGLCPPRLAYGADWFIELWEGTGWPTFDGDDLPEQLGKQLAALHAIDPSWFDPWREKLVEQYEYLRGVPIGSHVWFYAHRAGSMLGAKSASGSGSGHPTEWWLRGECRPTEWYDFFCKELQFEARSLAGRRIVTTHGDCHRQNLLMTDTGIKFIDLEFSCVTFAIFDLSYVITTCGWDDYAHWKNDKGTHSKFLRAYLRASNQPSEDSDVETLLLDCICFKEFIHCGMLNPWSIQPDLGLKYDDVSLTARQVFELIKEVMFSYPQNKVNMLEGMSITKSGTFEAKIEILIEIAEAARLPARLDEERGRLLRLSEAFISRRCDQSAMDAATKAATSINVTGLQEFKGLKSCPGGHTGLKVFSALLILIEKNYNADLNDSQRWELSKKVLMSDCETLIGRLRQYHGGDMLEEEAVMLRDRVLNDPDFNLKHLRKSSCVLGGLVFWVINVYKYNRILVLRQQNLCIKTLQHFKTVLQTGQNLDHEANIGKVFIACMILLANVKSLKSGANIPVEKSGKIQEKNQEWAVCNRTILGDVKQFVTDLRGYKDCIDKGEVPLINFEEVRPILALGWFNYKTIEKKCEGLFKCMGYSNTGAPFTGSDSRSAAHICDWVINIVRYHDEKIMGRNFWLALDRNFWEANKGNKDGQLPAKVQELLDKGADVHAATDNGQTALHFACTYQAGPEVVGLLLGKGVDVHAVENNKGRTALHSACSGKAGPEVVGLLLGKGADVHAVDSNKRTALHFACWNQAGPEVVGLLLDKNTEVNAEDKDKMTALKFACGNQAGPEVVALLLGKGADVHAVGNFKRTALHWACEKQAGLEVLGSLLHAGAENKNLREKDDTPLLTPKQVAEALGTAATPAARLPARLEGTERR